MPTPSVCLPQGTIAVALEGLSRTALYLPEALCDAQRDALGVVARACSTPPSSTTCPPLRCVADVDPACLPGESVHDTLALFHAKLSTTPSLGANRQLRNATFHSVSDDDAKHLATPLTPEHGNVVLGTQRTKGCSVTVSGEAVGLRDGQALETEPISVTFHVAKFGYISEAPWKGLWVMSTVLRNWYRIGNCTPTATAVIDTTFSHLWHPTPSTLKPNSNSEEVSPELLSDLAVILRRLLLRYSGGVQDNTMCLGEALRNRISGVLADLFFPSINPVDSEVEEASKRCITSSYAQIFLPSAILSPQQAFAELNKINTANVSAALILPRIGAAPIVFRVSRIHIRGDNIVVEGDDVMATLGVPGVASFRGSTIEVPAVVSSTPSVDTKTSLTSDSAPSTNNTKKARKERKGVREVEKETTHTTPCNVPQGVQGVSAPPSGSVLPPNTSKSDTEPISSGSILSDQNTIPEDETEPTRTSRVLLKARKERKGVKRRAEESLNNTSHPRNATQGVCGVVRSTPSPMLPILPRTAKTPKARTEQKGVKRQAEQNTTDTKRRYVKKEQIEGPKHIVKHSSKSMSVKPAWRPLRRPQSMFRDMAAKMQALYPRQTRRVVGTKLRMATMCSGSESPVLAMRLFEQCFGASFVEHVFSCEIEQFKQEFIERNFAPQHLFRDICELHKGEAETAFRGIEAVPKDIDLIVAGTVCKDFSALNNSKKGITDQGQSGRTFRGLIDYVKYASPCIVILENVRTAPWAEINAFFEAIRCPDYPERRYSVSTCMVDTKDYYLPQTRERGYLCASWNAAGLALFSEAVAELRYESGPTVASFLLPPQHPELARAKAVAHLRRRQASRQWRGRGRVNNTADRASDGLGTKTPYTNRSEDGTVAPPIWAWRAWLSSLTTRAQDSVDIHFLRRACSACPEDVMHKTYVLDILQSPYRTKYGGKVGLAPCLTPKGCFLVTDRGRPLLGCEMLALQGLPLEMLNLSRESDSQLRDLAGNAMSCTVVGAVMMSALLAVGPRREQQATPEISATATTPTMLHSTPQCDISAAAQLASDAGAVCPCEDDTTCVSAFLLCSDCGATACRSCHGVRQSTQHHMHDVARPTKHAPRETLLSLLPKTVRFVLDADDGSDIFAVQVADHLSTRPLLLTSLHRGEAWYAEYSSADEDVSATLHLNGSFEWRVYSTLRGLFTGYGVTAARAPLIRIDENGWALAADTVQLSVTVTGTHPTATWQQEMGIASTLSRPPSRLSVVLTDADQNIDIAGSYTHLPHCGGVCNALYRRVDGPPVFFFQSSASGGSPSADVCIFSSSCEHSALHAPQQDALAATSTGWRFSCGTQHLTCKSVVYQPASGTVQLNYGLEVSLPSAYPTTQLARCGVPFVAAVLRFPHQACEVQHHIAGAMLQGTPGWVHLCDSVLQEFCAQCSPLLPQNATLLQKLQYHRALKARPKAIHAEGGEGEGEEGRSIRLLVDPVTLLHRCLNVLKVRDHVSCRWRLSRLSVEMAEPLEQVSFPSFSTPVATAVRFEGALTESQGRALSWMREREREDDAQRWVEEEAEEAVVNGVLLEARVSRKVSVRGGVLACAPGWGKTVALCALLSTSPAKTLIIAPQRLVLQWEREIRRFTNIAPTVATTASGITDDTETLIIAAQLLEGLAPGVQKHLGLQRFCAAFDEAFGAGKVGLAFSWGRIVVDEFLQLSGPQKHIVRRLRGDAATWLLSASMDTRNGNVTAKVNTAASLLGAHIGTDLGLSRDKANTANTLPRAVSAVFRSFLRDRQNLFITTFLRSASAQCAAELTHIKTPLNLPNAALAVLMEIYASGVSKSGTLKHTFCLPRTQGGFRTLEELAQQRRGECATYKKKIGSRLERIIWGVADLAKQRGADPMEVKVLRLDITLLSTVGDAEAGRHIEEMTSSASDRVATAHRKPYLAPRGEYRDLIGSLRTVANKCASYTQRLRSLRLILAILGEGDNKCDCCGHSVHHNDKVVSPLCGHSGITAHFTDESLSLFAEDDIPKCPVEGCTAFLHAGMCFAAMPAAADRPVVDDPLATVAQKVVDVGEGVVVVAQNAATLASFGEELAKCGVHGVMSGGEGGGDAVHLLLAHEMYGLNLDTVRNIAFLHPLSAATEDARDALFARCVACVHRRSQQRPVRVYHFPIYNTPEMQIKYECNKIGGA